MILRLQKYNLAVKYCPGSQMYIADMLSKAFIIDQQHKEKTPYQIFKLSTKKQSVLKSNQPINFTDYLRVSEATQQLRRKRTQLDMTVQTLLATVHSGWTSRREDVSPTIRTYWGYNRDEITAQNGIPYKGFRNLRRYNRRYTLVIKG